MKSKYSTFSIVRTLFYLAAINLYLLLLIQNAYPFGESSKFVFAKLKYRGGNWDVRSDSGKRLVWELIKQTGVEAKLADKVVLPESREIFEFPFIYMAGDMEFDPFNEFELANLKKYLESGGTLLIDDCFGKLGTGFDKSVRREVKRLFPENGLVNLTNEHTIFRSFFLLKECAGRINENRFMEGVTLDDRTVIIYSRNDLGGAWARDNFGNWEFDVVPGGDGQRAKSFRLGINIILYALTGNYKQDQVHRPFISRRRR